MSLLSLSNDILLSCTQSQHERHENNLLKAENDRLRVENARYREALGRPCCPSCGGLSGMSFEEQHLSVENLRLRDEVNHFDHYIIQLSLFNL